MKINFSTLFKLFVIIASLAISNLSIAQFSLNDKIYFGSNTFVAALKEKGDLRLAVSNSTFNYYNSIFNYQAAYSPKKNIGIKVGYRHRASGNGSGNSVFDMNDFNFAAGFYKKIFTERGLSRYNWQMARLKNKADQKNTKRKWRNDWRVSQGKKAILHKIKKRRVPFFLFDIYAGYGFANLDGSLKTVFTTNPTTFKTVDFNLDRFNLDAGLSYFTMKFFSFNYNLRFSMVNFKDFKLYNPNSSTIETVYNLNDPYFAFEGAYKLNYHTKNADVYLQLNDIYGNMYNFENYANVAYKFNFTFGLVLNISNFGKN